MRECLVCKKEFEPNVNNRKYCYDCSPEKGTDVDRIDSLRKSMKKQAVKMFGGECIICGYKAYIGALDFHHLKEDEKETELGKCRNWTDYLTELKKCILVCANCHREIHGGIINIEKENPYLSDIESFIKDVNILSKDSIGTKKHYCSKCGITITSSSKSGLCLSCSRENGRLVERPSKEELLSLIKTHSFVKLGKMFNVSDNAIKRWCRDYDLPSRKKDIKLL